MFAAVKKAPAGLVSRLPRSSKSGAASALGDPPSSGAGSSTGSATSVPYPSSSASETPVAGPSSTPWSPSPSNFPSSPRRATIWRSKEAPSEAPGVTTPGSLARADGGSLPPSGPSSLTLEKERGRSSYLPMLGETSASGSATADSNSVDSTDPLLKAFGRPVPYPAQLPQHVLSFLLSYPRPTRRRHSMANVDFYTGRVGGLEYEGRDFKRQWRARETPPTKDSPSGNGVSWCLEQLYNHPGRMFNEPQLWPWLFPLPQHGADKHAAPLQAHEIEPILNSVNATRRLERAHVLTMRMLGIRMADLGTGLLTPAFDSADLFPLFTNPATAKTTSAILTRLLQSLTLFSPDAASKSSFLRHMPSTIGFLIAAHNEGLLDLARGTDAGFGLEKEWGLSVINRQLREELMELALARKDHSSPLGAEGASTWGFAEYERWVVRQNLRHGRLHQRFREVLLPLESPGPGEPAPVESDEAKENRWVELVLAKLKAQAADLEYKDKIRKGLIKVEKPATEEVENVTQENAEPVARTPDV